jgi:hypothetical protein
MKDNIMKQIDELKKTIDKSFQEHKAFMQELKEDIYQLKEDLYTHDLVEQIIKELKEKFHSNQYQYNLSVEPETVNKYSDYLNDVLDREGYKCNYDPKKKTLYIRRKTK